MSRPIGDLSSYRPSCRQDVTLIVLKDGVLLRPDQPLVRPRATRRPAEPFDSKAEEV